MTLLTSNASTIPISKNSWTTFNAYAQMLDKDFQRATEAV